MSWLSPSEPPRQTPSHWSTPALWMRSDAVPLTGERTQASFLVSSFFWMMLALLVSAATAGLALTNAGTITFLRDSFILLMFAELGLVIVLTAAINRLSGLVALTMLFVFAAINGIMLSSLFYVYQLSAITTAFFGGAAIFGAAGFYGAITQRDMTRWIAYLFPALVGLVVMLFVNLLVGGDAFSLFLGMFGVLIFTAFTAYDVQRLTRGKMAWIASRENASVLGALALYLDFINLFLSLLRIFGGMGGRR